MTMQHNIKKPFKKDKSNEKKKETTQTSNLCSSTTAS